MLQSAMTSWDAPQFTCEYSQPASYRFSLDSILLAKAVARDLKAQAVPTDFKILDLCAGAGVVGLELAHLHSGFKSIDFLEIQPEYQSHFNINLKRSEYLDLKTCWLPLNYAELQQPKYAERYDLIVCNPPYFEPEQGLIPPDSLKARSRFFIDASFAELWKSIIHILRPQGQAYVLVRSQSAHGQNRHEQIQALCGDQAAVVSVEDLRGTDLYRLRKPCPVS